MRKCLQTPLLFSIYRQCTWPALRTAATAALHHQRRLKFTHFAVAPRFRLSTPTTTQSSRLINNAPVQKDSDASKVVLRVIKQILDEHSNVLTAMSSLQAALSTNIEWPEGYTLESEIRPLVAFLKWYIGSYHHNHEEQLLLSLELRDSEQYQMPKHIGFSGDPQAELLSEHKRFHDQVNKLVEYVGEKEPWSESHVNQIRILAFEMIDQARYHIMKENFFYQSMADRVSEDVDMCRLLRELDDYHTKIADAVDGQLKQHIRNVHAISARHGL